MCDGELKFLNCNEVIWLKYNSVWIYSYDQWKWTEYLFSICYLNSLEAFLKLGGGSKDYNYNNNIWFFKDTTKNELILIEK